MCERHCILSTKEQIEDTNFTSARGNGTAILRGHPSHPKVQPFAVQRQYLRFSVISRLQVLVRRRKSNPATLPLCSKQAPYRLT